MIQGLNSSLLRCRWILYHLSHWGSPEMNVRNLKPVKTRLERQTCNYAHTKANILGLFAFFDFLGHQIYWYDELKFNY